jgi:hypothetical protein
MKALVIAGLVGLTSACALDASTSAVGEESSSTTYVDMYDFPGIDQDAFVSLESQLAQAFANVCGDTFCEGDYVNLTPMTLACSVTSKLGDVHDCAWTFAGSLEAVDPTTSAISVDAPSFQCHFAAKTTGAKLIAFLSSQTDPLNATLPGETTSIYDALVPCFQNPIGKTPVTFTDATKPTYVEASDYYKSGSYQAQWSKAKAALANGFYDVCGDTFCDGDYNPIVPMDFVCSVTASTGNVKDCKWVFEGSYAFPGKGGVEAVSAKSWTCDVPMKGTLSQLMSVVNATNTTGVLDRTLPGGTATAYDALLNCL